MATPSSILTWRIPWTIQSMNLQRIGHDLMAKPPPHDVFEHMYTCISLACCDSWGHKESDTTERLNQIEATTTNRVNKVKNSDNTKCWQRFRE